MTTKTIRIEYDPDAGIASALGLTQKGDAAPVAVERLLMKIRDMHPRITRVGETLWAGMEKGKICSDVEIADKTKLTFRITQVGEGFAAECAGNWVASAATREGCERKILESVRKLSDMVYPYRNKDGTYCVVYYA